MTDTMNDETSLWRAGRVECVMVSCCSGAELQLREVRLKPDATDANAAGADGDDGRGGEYAIVLRELYPTKSDLYERSRALEREYLQRELE